MSMPVNLPLQNPQRPPAARGDAQVCLRKLKKPFDLEAEKRRLPDVQDDFFWHCFRETYPCTLLSSERLLNLYQATEYIARRGVPGDFVECGVFLGGAVMFMARKLMQLGDTSRKLWLYDTYCGFTGGLTEDDINHMGARIGGSHFSDFLEQTRRNVTSVGYPAANLELIAGDVCQTLPRNDAEHLALLRLDTDTYTSTAAELEYLYPKLVTGGVLIIDDYGYSRGVRKAVDQYFAATKPSLFFQRPDFSSRTAIKC